jgi:hypothetical protein
MTEPPLPKDSDSALWECPTHHVVCLEVPGELLSLMTLFGSHSGLKSSFSISVLRKISNPSRDLGLITCETKPSKALPWYRARWGAGLNAGQRPGALVVDVDAKQGGAVR